MTDKSLKQSAIKLLQEIVRTPSFSTEEEFTSQLISEWFESHQIEWKREKNNVWSINRNFDVTKPTILLNSHHDTVNPNKAYTRDPFDGSIEGDKLYGLGSNDAGGPLVALLVFLGHVVTPLRMKRPYQPPSTSFVEASAPRIRSRIAPLLCKAKGRGTLRRLVATR